MDLLCATCTRNVLDAEDRREEMTFTVPNGVELPEDLGGKTLATETADETIVTLTRWRRWDAFRIVLQGGHVQDKNRFPVMKAATFVAGTALCPNHLTGKS